MDLGDVRYYFFGTENNLRRIDVIRGGYLTPDRIRHYEDIYGPLYSVKYKGKITFCE